MKVPNVLLPFILVSFFSVQLSAQTSKKDASSYTTKPTRLFIDVHRLEPGKVKYEEVAKAHAKDLAVEKKYGVDFIKYWVDEKEGVVYCLSSAIDTQSIRNTHAQAHGLLPHDIYEVTEGTAASLKDSKDLFLDIHYLGAGKVTAKDVAAAHEKDLAVQQKYGVNFINYWVDEKAGVVMCLSEAKDSASIARTHKEAHGLLPAQVLKVKQGQ
jgi:hypothetical protein